MKYLMTAPLDNLIEALRNELQQYGEMLALLDHQRELVKQRGSDDILHSIAAISTQSEMIQVARETRMFNQRQLAQALKEPLDAPFGRLIPRMPAEYQPLVRALIQENNELLLRVRDRAQENQVLLRRSVDMMQQFITAITPHKRAAPSGKEGQVLAAEAAGAFYEAIL
jgi:hypothetical protein